MLSFQQFFKESVSLKFDRTKLDGISYPTVNGLPYKIKNSSGNEIRYDVYLYIDNHWELIDAEILSGPQSEDEIDQAFIQYFTKHSVAEQDDENPDMTDEQDTMNNPVDMNQQSTTSTQPAPAQPTAKVNPAVQPTNTAIANDPSFKVGTTSLGGKNYDTVNNIPLQVQNQGGKKNAYLLLNNAWTLISPNANDDLQIKSDLKNYFQKSINRS